jgi:hypothetical protein
VLQKLVGVGGEAGERLLCRQPEQLVDDVILSQDIPFGDPFQLAFAEHVHRFITLDGPLGRSKCPKPQPRVHAAFHKSMILFNGVVTNDKFCLIRHCQVQLRWSRQPYRSRPRRADDLLDETSHREGSHETALAGTTAIPANGGRGAAMGSGVPIPAALDDTDRAVHRVRPISHTTGGGDA